MLLKASMKVGPAQLQQLSIFEKHLVHAKLFEVAPLPASSLNFPRKFSTAQPPKVLTQQPKSDLKAARNAQSIADVAQAARKTPPSPNAAANSGLNIDPLMPKVIQFSTEEEERQQGIEELQDSDAAEDENYEDMASLLTARRVDPATVRQVFYFDTLALSKKLEAKGFTREQAEGCAECLVEIINTTLDHQGRHMVTKPQQEIAVQQLYSEIVSVKKDLTLLQKSEFSALKTETQKMNIQMNQIQDHLNDEIVKLKGHFNLDLNLEKGRAIEAHAANEKKLQILHNKIDTDVANLKTMYEKYRNDIFKYAGGTVIAVGSLVLGVIRLMH